jgi:hypothetical protein
MNPPDTPDEPEPVGGPTFRPVTLCPKLGKVTHPSRKIATTEMRRHLKKLREKGERVTFNIYLCPHCGGWHCGGNDARRPENGRRRGSPRCKRVEYDESEEAA